MTGIKMERKFASEETKQPLFSVIMPVYNVEKYVSQQERGQVRLLLKMMDMKEILGQGE